MNMLRVAIIEDDVDLMQQMCSEIRRYFMVDSYMNGKDGYDGVIANSPDLILCDVMLPGMNGYDIVKKIKMMPSMKCVPVIMLTALDDEEHQIKGYEAGADDYMVKPCNYKVLIARMAQLINWKKRNDTSMVAREGKMEKTGETVILKEADKVLKERIETIVMRNFADADFSVETMAEKLHLGSTKLFGKTKELMGMTPAKYILNIRMKKAAEMLLEGEHDIYEISLSVGFRDPSYFNKCFKSVYGKSPSKYGK
jgi:YesN/AraC family two-component response regulator